MTVTAQQPTTAKFSTGDTVHVKSMFTHAGITGPWVIEKFLQKNYEMRRPDDYTGPNKHKKLRAKPHQIERIESLTTEQAAAGEGNVVMAQVNEYPIRNEGQVVTVTDPKGKVPSGLYVITKSNLVGNPGRVNIVQLFGGQAWRVPATWTTVIEKDSVQITYRSQKNAANA
jgi:hypothetical protein